MYRAASEALPVERAVVTAAPDHTGPLHPHAEIFEAGHPSPNDASVAAADRALALATESASKGGLLVLLSGGASAMLAAPGQGLTLEDKIQVSRRLMEAGAPIHELNCVRKHLSRIKGGQLARAAGVTTTLALSDVHGPIADDPSVIASGPTVADETTFADALEVIRHRRIAVPSRVEDYLLRGAAGAIDETIKPGDQHIAASRYTVIGNRQTAVAGATRAAEARGYGVAVIPDATQGEARLAAREFVARGVQIREVAGRPLCVIGSGETTVTVRGDGLGGRNQEFALSVLPVLADLGHAVSLGSAGTDGIDGPTPAAGAIADSTSLSRASHLGISWDSALARNDAYRFFDALGDLILWGPTGTNVSDLHVLLMA